MKILIQNAVDDGAIYVKGTVTKFLCDGQRECFGVELNGGQEIAASDVILSMGDGIATLVANSAPDKSNIE